MKSTLYLLIILLFISPDLVSQTDRSNPRFVDFHIMPYTLLDYTPRLRLGVEYYPGSRFAYCLEAGMGSSDLNAGRLDGLIWGTHYTFNEIRPEIKYYFFNRNNNLSLYLAGELFALQMKDILNFTFYHPENADYLLEFDEATFLKYKAGFHLKTGMKVVVFKMVSLDFYTGVGMAGRSIRYTNIFNPVETDYFMFEEWFPQTFRHEGDDIIFHITMGCKVGLTLQERRQNFR